MGTIKDIHEYLSQRLRIKEEDMRLWLYNSENYLTLLDDEDHTLESLKIQDEQHLVIEVRNKDMSWPEEMSFIANSSKIDRHKGNVRGLGKCWKNLCKLEAGQAIYKCLNVYLSLTLPRWHYNTIILTDYLYQNTYHVDY